MHSCFSHWIYITLMISTWKSCFAGISAASWAVASFYVCIYYVYTSSDTVQVVFSVLAMEDGVPWLHIYIIVCVQEISLRSISMSGRIHLDEQSIKRSSTSSELCYCTCSVLHSFVYVCSELIEHQVAFFPHINSLKTSLDYRLM